MLAFAGSARALDTAPPTALTLESVPPPSLSQVTLPALDPMVTVPLLAESDTPTQRPVIVVRLQPADPILDHTANNVAVQQSDADWETRRKDRLARFAELAARNTASHKPASQL